MNTHRRDAAAVPLKEPFSADADWERLRALRPREAMGRDLALMRKYHWFTQGEAAELLEVTVLHLSQWESGIGRMSIDEAYAISGLYGCEAP